MNDSHLHTGLLALLVALGAAACMSPEPTSRRRAEASAADMPVVMLPAVVMTARRVPATDAVAAAPHVLHLPLVSLQGRRAPTMEPVALASSELFLK